MLDFVIFFFGSAFFAFCIIFLSKRKRYQPLKSRSYMLIGSSTIGNFLYFILVMVAKIIANNYWSMWDDLEDVRANQ